MQKASKKIIVGFAVGSAVVLGGLSPDTVFAVDTSVNVSINVNQHNGGLIDLTKDADSSVVAIGVSRPDARGIALAREAAIMAAERNLISIVQGMQIDSDTTMRDLAIESDVVNRKITGTLRGAQIVDEGATADGGYYIKMRVPIYGANGSIAAAITPALVKSTPTPFANVTVSQTSLTKTEIKTVQESAYTGVIIDAAGLGLKTTFSPVIYDTNGRAIYGIQNLQYDAIINEGMVGYKDTLQDATAGSRAGNNPLIVKAVETRGGNNSANKVNVVVSEADADRILLANEKSKMLENCAVVFVR